MAVILLLPDDVTLLHYLIRRVVSYGLHIFNTIFLQENDRVPDLNGFVCTYFLGLVIKIQNRMTSSLIVVDAQILLIRARKIRNI